MRDYKARPRPRAKKAPRRSPLPRFGRQRAPLPKGFQPLAAPHPRPPSRRALHSRPRPPAGGGRGEGPGRAARAWHGLRALPLRRIAFWGALVWLLAGLASGAVALWQSPLQSVALSGNRVVSARAILRLGGLAAGMRMSEVDPFETARRIATHPRLTAVDVRRVFPGRVAIRVRERQPALRVRLDDGRTALVDADDMVLALRPAGAETSPALAGLPLVTGVRATPQLSQVLDDPALQRARAALAAIKRLHPDATAPLAIAAGNPFLLGLGLPDGTRLILPPGRLESALRTWRRLRRDYPEVFRGHRTVDLTTLTPRAGGRVVLRAD